MHALLLALPLLVSDEPFLVEGEAQTVFDAEVVSVTNDNSRYQARVTTMFARLSSPPAKLGEFEFEHESMNPVHGITKWVTTVDAGGARAVSELLGVEVEHRAPWPYELEASLEVAPFRASDVEIAGRLVLRNPSPGEVIVVFRNPSPGELIVPVSGMRITIEGEEIRLAEQMHISIEAGGETEVDLDLRHWHDFPVAGIYEAEVQIDATLELEGEGRWDEAITCTSELEVERPEQPRLIAVDEHLEPSDVSVEARDNTASSFSLTMAVPMAPPESLRAWPQLHVGERTYSFQSFGNAHDHYRITTTLTAAEAQGVAAAFGVPVLRRSHPGHRLTATCEKADGLDVRFLLTNEGERAIEYLNGGASRNEKGRDNRFEVTVLRDGEEVELPVLYDFGGLAGHMTLAPGETQVIELDLEDWYDFEAPGEYRVTLRLPLSVWPPGAMTDRYQVHQCWDDQAIASITFRRE